MIKKRGGSDTPIDDRPFSGQTAIRVVGGADPWDDSYYDPWRGGQGDRGRWYDGYEGGQTTPPPPPDETPPGGVEDPDQYPYLGPPPAMTEDPNQVPQQGGPGGLPWWFPWAKSGGQIIDSTVTNAMLEKAKRNELMRNEGDSSSRYRFLKGFQSVKRWGDLGISLYGTGAALAGQKVGATVGSTAGNVGIGATTEAGTQVGIETLNQTQQVAQTAMREKIRRAMQMALEASKTKEGKEGILEVLGTGSAQLQSNKQDQAIREALREESFQEALKITSQAANNPRKQPHDFFRRKTINEQRQEQLARQPDVVGARGRGWF